VSIKVVVAACLHFFVLPKMMIYLDREYWMIFVARFYYHVFLAYPKFFSLSFSMFDYHLYCLFEDAKNQSV
jgi:hypothetical protein